MLSAKHEHSPDLCAAGNFSRIIPCCSPCTETGPLCLGVSQPSAQGLGAWSRLCWCCRERLLRGNVLCDTGLWYSTLHKQPHPLPSGAVSGQEKAEASAISPSRFGILSSMSRSLCRTRDLFGFSGDEIVQILRGIHTHVSSLKHFLPTGLY